MHEIMDKYSIKNQEVKRIYRIFWKRNIIKDITNCKNNITGKLNIIYKHNLTHCFGETNLIENSFNKKKDNFLKINR